MLNLRQYWPRMEPRSQGFERPEVRSQCRVAKLTPARSIDDEAKYAAAAFNPQLLRHSEATATLRNDAVDIGLLAPGGKAYTKSFGGPDIRSQCRKAELTPAGNIDEEAEYATRAFNPQLLRHSEAIATLRNDAVDIGLVALGGKAYTKSFGGPDIRSQCRKPELTPAGNIDEEAEYAATAFNSQFLRHSEATATLRNDAVDIGLLAPGGKAYTKSYKHPDIRSQCRVATSKPTRSIDDEVEYPTTAFNSQLLRHSEATATLRNDAVDTGLLAPRGKAYTKSFGGPDIQSQCRKAELMPAGNIDNEANYVAAAFNSQLLRDSELTGSSTNDAFNSGLVAPAGKPYSKSYERPDIRSQCRKANMDNEVKYGATALSPLSLCHLEAAVSPTIDAVNTRRAPSGYRKTTSSPARNIDDEAKYAATTFSPLLLRRSEVAVSPTNDAVDPSLVAAERYDPQSKAFSYVPAHSLQEHFNAPRKATKLIPIYDKLPNDGKQTPSSSSFGPLDVELLNVDPLYDTPNRLKKPLHVQTPPCRYKEGSSGNGASLLTTAPEYTSIARRQPPSSKDWLERQMEKLNKRRDPDALLRKEQERMLLDELKHVNDERRRSEADYCVEGYGAKRVDGMEGVDGYDVEHDERYGTEHGSYGTNLDGYGTQPVNGFGAYGTNPVEGYGPEHGAYGTQGVNGFGTNPVEGYGPKHGVFGTDPTPRRQFSRDDIYTKIATDRMRRTPPPPPPLPA
uniref:Uncharacterized protein n=1 Tax=Romanomermis culicivorax TaxID=13658 RepID=A0A915IKK5_ROMCU